MISLHLHLLVNAIKQKESNKNLIRTPSLYLLSCLFKDRATGVIRNNSNYKYIVQWIQSPKNVSFEKKLQRMGFPISKQNQLQLEKADKEALENSLESLKKVKESVEALMPEDFYSIDLMDAYADLGLIIGESVEDDLVNEIFSKFCMGK